MQEVTTMEFASNSVWKFLELFSKKVIALVLSTILALLLSPDVYGIVALTTVFITFSDIFIMNGFNVALVRKKEICDVDYSTVMVMGVCFSTVLYALFFFLAPFLAKFYKEPEFCNVLRVLSVLIFFKAIASVIKARATRELQFKKMSFVSVLTSTLAILFGIAFAINGFGVYALVFQQLLANLLDVIALSFVFRWKYSLRFSKQSAGEMTRFTLGVLGTSFLDFFGNNLSNLVVPKVYSSTELGYLNRGNAYPETIGLNMYNSINGVLLPTLASRQDNEEGMKRAIRKVISVSCYMIFPLMFGMIAVSDSFVTVVLTEKWVPCIPILICSSLLYALNPIRAIGYNVFYAIGKSKRCVQIEAVRTLLYVLNLLVTIVVLRKSIYVFAALNVGIALVCVIITQHLVGKCVQYRWQEFFKDVIPTFLLCIVMILGVRTVCYLKISGPIILVLQIVLGALIYVVGSIITRNSSWLFLSAYLSQMLVSRLKGHKERNR